MTVIQADGQNVEPVPVDEFRIGIAETYDVIAEPKEEKPFTIFAESLDRSDYARGTLAPREGMEAPVPDLRPRPKRSMKDMGMNMDMAGMKMDGNVNNMDGMGYEGYGDMKMDHSGMSMSGMADEPVKHGPPWYRRRGHCRLPVRPDG